MVEMSHHLAWLSALSLSFLLSCGHPTPKGDPRPPRGEWPPAPTGNLPVTPTGSGPTEAVKSPASGDAAARQDSGKPLPSTPATPDHHGNEQPTPVPTPMPTPAPAPAPAPAPTVLSSTFMRRCAPCHGRSGNNVRMFDLTKSTRDFPAYQSAVRAGTTGGMPAIVSAWYDDKDLAADYTFLTGRAAH